MSGEGLGKGTNINIPLPFSADGYSDSDYACLLRELIIPIAVSFQPDLVIVAAGYDSCIGDPLGSNSLSPQWFGFATELLRSIPSCGAKILLVLEGGYNTIQTAECIHACISTLLYNSSETGHFSRDYKINTEHKKCIDDIITKLKTMFSELWPVLSASEYSNV